MALICDTSGLYAIYDADDDHHLAVRSEIEAETGPLMVPAVLLAEIDYLLTSRLGQEAELSFLDDLLSGAFTLIPVLREDIERSRAVIEKYRDLELGIADAMVVSVAERLGIRRLLTLDRRHFRAIEPLGLGYFVLLPQDHGAV